VEKELKKFLWALSILIMLYGGPIWAGVARARWINSRELVVKVPHGLTISQGSTKFFLTGGNAVSNGVSFQLPLLSLQGVFAKLSSGHITKENIDNLIRGSLKLVTTDSNNQIIDSTQVQLAGLLDELYYYSGNDLGADCDSLSCHLRLWAPTAENVQVIFENGEKFQSQREISGTWALTLSPKYKNRFFKYEILLYQPTVQRFETVSVTDPYSRSLSLNGAFTQLVDLNSSEAKPIQWDHLIKPKLNDIIDSVIYELHIRDFSAQDFSIPQALRGTYLAFSESSSAGTQHLKALAQAGMTHVHLLPFNDFGSVNEDKALWKNYTGPSQSLIEPQQILGQIRREDPYNWGYDPVHFFAPEGSYSINANGVSRIYEVRQMVQALNALGLRVVQDVVFNHTYRNGLMPLSIFDKIVPLYYYRLNDEGEVYNSSCCADTASEHRMMEKLMTDAVLFWAKEYKIDGFRFDLVSFHSIETIQRIQNALRNLSLAQDGIDGTKILIFGEGWNFGSFFEKSSSQAMTMENGSGRGFGFFNDRMRDAIRGGTTNNSEKSDQGFVTGLYFDFNKEPANRNTPTALDQQRSKILHLGDVIKAGLAGNLRDFKFKEHLGQTIRAGDLYYRGARVGVAQRGLETINYVSAHDGYTLWDAIQAKAPFWTWGRTPTTCTVDDRQRIAQLAMAFPLLGQGLPFIEAGTELLRSKNGDQDSYDSGDFFNSIIWNQKENNWGRGLPPSWKNQSDWSFWEPRLDDSFLQVQSKHIQKTNEYFKALLRLRRSSELFRLNSLENISQALQFVDNDLSPEPGLIAMHLQNSADEFLILLNASPAERIFRNPILQKPWKLHPLLDQTVDPVLANTQLRPDQSLVQIPGISTLVLHITVPSKAKK
jgi:pullulanase